MGDVLETQGAGEAAEGVRPAEGAQGASDAAAVAAATPEGGEGASAVNVDVDKLLPDIDTRVPYPKFREAQTQATRLRRQLEQVQPEFERIRGRASALEEQIRSQGTELEDLRSVMGIIQAEPELYDRVMALAGAKPAAQGNGRTNGGARPEDRVASLDPETDRMIRENAEFIRQAKAREAALHQERSRQADLETLRTTVTGLLDRANIFPKDAYAKVVPRVMRDIIGMAQTLEDEGTMEDVPRLFKDWLREEMELTAHRDRHRLSNAREVKAPPPVSGGAPVQPLPKAEPLSSPSVRAQAVRVLMERGWGQNAA